MLVLSVNKDLICKFSFGSSFCHRKWNWVTLPNLILFDFGMLPVLRVIRRNRVSLTLPSQRYKSFSIPFQHQITARNGTSFGPKTIHVSVHWLEIVNPAQRFFTESKNTDTENAPEIKPLKTIIKKFYLRVHPDLFANHPKERVKHLITQISIILGCQRKIASILPKLHR
jgi:hypothetical protein